MQLVTLYLRTLFNLLADSAPFLLVGFFLAGLLRILIPRDRVYRHLGKDDLGSVTRAALLGIPLPLCSCSVLPTAASLRKSGASKGATTAFLISTPETGPDSIGLTFALLDPLMALLRPLAALFTAFVAGGLVNRMVLSGKDRGGVPVEKDEEGEASPEEKAGRRSVGAVLKEANVYAFGSLLDELAPWFVVGFLLSAALAVAIPDRFFLETLPGAWASILLMLVVGVPIYICAAAATPLAAALVAKGLPPGAALVLLLVGPATNLTTILVVSRLLGKRATAVYLLSVAGCAVILGAFVNGLYADLGLDLAANVSGKLVGGVSLLETLTGIVFLVLLVRSLHRTGAVKRVAARLRSSRRVLGFDPTGRAARFGAAAILVALWLTTCFSVVRPGEVGWVVRFGAVRREVRVPGLVAHLPAPIDRFIRVRAGKVRSVALGYAPADAEAEGGSGEGQAPARSEHLAAEARVLTGDESLLRLTFGVQFDVSNAFAWRFGVKDPEDLVRAYAATAVREAVAHRDVDDILVGHRAEIEEETRKSLQDALDRVGAGVNVKTVTFRYLHAPREVHFAYRDVASSLEDKERDVHDAEGAETVRLGNAHVEALDETTKAEGYRSDRTSVARGQAAAFLSRLAAFRGNEKITEFRLAMEAAEKALPSSRLFLLLGNDADVDLYDLDAKVVPLPAGGTEKSK